MWSTKKDGANLKSSSSNSVVQWWLRVDKSSISKWATLWMPMSGLTKATKTRWWAGTRWRFGTSRFTNINIFLNKTTYLKNDFAVVESVERSQMGDIIPISQCRHPALPTSVSASTVKSLTIELNDELLDYFSRSEENYKVLQQSIPAILIKFNREEKTLVVKVLSIL